MPILPAFGYARTCSLRFAVQLYFTVHGYTLVAHDRTHTRLFTVLPGFYAVTRTRLRCLPPTPPLPRFWFCYYAFLSRLCGYGWFTQFTVCVTRTHTAPVYGCTPRCYGCTYVGWFYCLYVYVCSYVLRHRLVGSRWVPAYHYRALRCSSPLVAVTRVLWFVGSCRITRFYRYRGLRLRYTRSAFVLPAVRFGLRYAVAVLPFRLFVVAYTHTHHIHLAARWITLYVRCYVTYHAFAPCPCGYSSTTVLYAVLVLVYIPRAVIAGLIHHRLFLPAPHVPTHTHARLPTRVGCRLRLLHRSHAHAHCWFAGCAVLCTFGSLRLRTRTFHFAVTRSVTARLHAFCLAAVRTVARLGYTRTVLRFYTHRLVSHTRFSWFIPAFCLTVYRFYTRTVTRTGSAVTG